mmetsp:Transcript_2479/g.5420  ORF Transcript_2479/g.5420 Transcript_2479/m.5420 type:complete len:239 (+) Transcript_2479:108-824(+)
MANTGHDEFDRLAREFSATVKEIEAKLHERASNNCKNDNAGRVETTELIRKASSILAKLSSTTKMLSDTEVPGLKQELVDIYEAYKMQMKTYKSLNQQPELFRNTSTTNSLSNGMLMSDRSSLFSSATGKTGGSSNDNDSARYSNNSTRSGNNFKNNHPRDRIVSNTKGKINKQNSRLHDALRSIKESEQVAQEISGELHGQRETLGKTQGRLDQFSSMTEYSKGLLKSMNKPWWRKW